MEIYDYRVIEKDSWLFGKTLDINQEHELNFDNEFGAMIIVVYNKLAHKLNPEWYEKQYHVYRNITEFHWMYNLERWKENANQFPMWACTSGGYHLEYALESDILGTGGTKECRLVESIAIYTDVKIVGTGDYVNFVKHTMPEHMHYVIAQKKAKRMFSLIS